MAPAVETRSQTGRKHLIVGPSRRVSDETYRRLYDAIVTMRSLPDTSNRACGYEPYATSHDALDRDTVVQREVRSAAKALVAAVPLSRAGRFRDLDTESDPRPK
jgi:hypothetical protein